MKEFTKLERQCVSEHLRLLRATVDKTAWCDEELSIHYDEWDEKYMAYVPVIVDVDRSVALICDMYGSQSHEGC